MADRRVGICIMFGLDIGTELRNVKYEGEQTEGATKFHCFPMNNVINRWTLVILLIHQTLQ
jgi:hypothetical protein